MEEELDEYSSDNDCTDDVTVHSTAKVDMPAVFDESYIDRIVASLDDWD